MVFRYESNMVDVFTQMFNRSGVFFGACMICNNLCNCVKDKEEQ